MQKFNKTSLTKTRLLPAQSKSNKDKALAMFVTLKSMYTVQKKKCHKYFIFLKKANINMLIAFCIS